MNDAKVLLLAALFVCGCSDPKDTMIPKGDVSDWPENYKTAVTKLSDEEKQLLAGYMMRQAFDPESANAVTIEDALENQQMFIREQEAREAEELVLAAKATQKRERALAELRNSVTVALVEKNYLSENYDAGRFSDQVKFVFAIENKTDQKIRGVKGQVIFRDLFGDEIMQMRLSIDDSIDAKKSVTIDQYGLDINQFMDDHVKLATIDLDDLKFEFAPEMIVFADGTVQSIESNEE